MEERRIVVATRKSELALAQCRQFLSKLVARHPHVTVEELHVVTTGDQITDRPLASIGGKGLFLKEIEEKLLSGEADIAVHSLKDVPPEIHPDLCFGNPKCCAPNAADDRCLPCILPLFDGTRRTNIAKDRRRKNGRIFLPTQPVLFHRGRQDIGQSFLPRS